MYNRPLNYTPKFSNIAHTCTCRSIPSSFHKFSLCILVAARTYLIGITVLHVDNVVVQCREALYLFLYTAHVFLDVEKSTTEMYISVHVHLYMNIGKFTIIDLSGFSYGLFLRLLNWSISFCSHCYVILYYSCSWFTLHLLQTVNLLWPLDIHVHVHVQYTIVQGYPK